MILFIWDYNDKVYSKMFNLSKVMDVKELKVNGRKPNKVIIPSTLYKDKFVKKVKKLSAYNAIIVEAKKQNKD